MSSQRIPVLVGRAIGSFVLGYTIPLSALVSALGLVSLATQDAYFLTNYIVPVVLISVMFGVAATMFDTINDIRKFRELDRLRKAGRGYPHG